MSCDHLSLRFSGSGHWQLWGRGRQRAAAARAEDIDGLQGAWHQIFCGTCCFLSQVITAAYRCDQPVAPYCFFIQIHALSCRFTTASPLHQLPSQSLVLSVIHTPSAQKMPMPAAVPSVLPEAAAACGYWTALHYAQHSPPMCSHIRRHLCHECESGHLPLTSPHHMQ